MVASPPGCPVFFYGKIGTHSRLAIGILNGTVKSAVQPKSGFPCTDPLQRVPGHELQTAPEGGALQRHSLPSYTVWIIPMRRLPHDY
jgi:hypothetical protein